MNYSLMSESTKLSKYETSSNWFKENDMNNLINRNKLSEMSLGLQDTAAFQVVFSKAEKDYIVDVSQNSYVCIKGDYEIFRVETVTDDSTITACQNILGAVDDNDNQLWFDILNSSSQQYIDRYELCSVYVELKSERSSKIGKHFGKVNIYKRNMFSKEELICSLDFSFLIFNVEVSPPQENKFYLDIWQHNYNIARKHEVTPFSNEHFVIMEKYIEALAQLGQKAVTIIASDAPWASQSSFYNRENLSDMTEYSYINVTKEMNGKFSCNFANLERYINLCFKHGIKDEIEVFGLLGIWHNEENGFGNIAKDYPEAIKIRFYDKASNSFDYMRKSEDIVTYIGIIYKYFLMTGLIDKVRIVADEPTDKEDFIKKIATIREIAPKFKYKVAVYKTEIINGIKDIVSDICPTFMTFCDFKKDMENILASNENVKYTYYVACSPSYPNTFIRSPLLESRLLPIMAKFLGVSGLLRWAFTCWPNTPREKLAFRWASGDTCFVYPSNGGLPLLSLRYKMLKRGITDYELLAQCPASVEKLYFDKIIKIDNLENFYKIDDKSKIYSVNNQDYSDAKKILLDYLERK